MRHWILSCLLLFGAAALADDLPEMTVYKTPTCGCCGKWVTHLEENGFSVKTITLEDLTGIKTEAGVPSRLASCHTGVIDGYAIEGHIPASDILRLLKEKPDVAGLAVPGMPIGSPGMEMGDRRDPYRVYSFDEDGELAVYAEH